MAQTPNFYSKLITAGFQFQNVDGTNPRIMYQVAENSPGVRFHQINVSNNQAATFDMHLYIGKPIWTTAAATYGAVTLSGNTLQRTVGDWRTADKPAKARLLIAYPIKRLAAVGSNSPAALGNGAFYNIASYNATGSQLLTTGNFTANDTLPDGTIIYECHKLFAPQVPSNAGINSSNQATHFLRNDLMPALDAAPGRYITLGAGDVLIGALSGGLTDGNQIEVTLFGASYE